MRPKYIAPMALVIATLVLSSSCSSSSSSTGSPASTSTTSPAMAVRSFILGGTQSIDLLQFKGTDPLQGVFEEVLGPQVTSDNKAHDYVYRLSGSRTGRTMTYQLVAVTPDTPALPGTLTGIVGAHTVTLSQPVTGTPGRVMSQSTQREFDALVHVHESTWRLSG